MGDELSSYGHAGGGRKGRAVCPRVGVITNPRSHRNTGGEAGDPSRAEIEIAAPATKPAIGEALKGFADRGIDLLVVSGGDGTVRDVLTMGQTVFGADWPAIAVLPRGKTNALNADLRVPAGWTLDDAVEAFRNGGRLNRRPLAVRRLDGGGTGEPMLGFILGAGIFTLGIDTGQDAHRMGFVDSLAVGLTSAWGIAQTVFGGPANRWRRGTAMRLIDIETGRELPRSAQGEPGRRSILLASTLGRMPLGIHLFGKGQEGIRLAVLDAPLRRVMGFVPAMLAGWHPRWLSGAGLHHLSLTGFEMDIGDAFVLDGESFPAGRYQIDLGPDLTFVTTR